jgi:cell pole-organizing protein PopZ
MNAPNSLSQDEQATERRGYEPSMEEILASIRRIIADDQSVGPQPPPATPKEEMPRAAFGTAPAGVTVKPWDLRIGAPRSEAVAKPLVAAPAEVIAPDLDEDVKESLEAELEVAASSPPPPRETRPKIETHQPDRGAAPRSEQSDSQAGGRDKAPDRWRGTPAPAAQATANEDPLVSPATNAAVSAAFDALIASRFLHSNELISDMVREMLRPMLKAWLDDNLPILVERLVRAEIERVARGGR